MNDLIFRLKKRAEIRRQIRTRKSVQNGEKDRISDLLEEAATYIDKLKEALEKISTCDAGIPLGLIVLPQDLKAACKQLNEDRHYAAMLAREALAETSQGKDGIGWDPRGIDDDPSKDPWRK